MTSTATEGHYLRGPKGRIFLLVRRPKHIVGVVLVVQPFAEEMNKCRAMVTKVALRLVESGYVVLLPDLYGTGDSGGDFVEADWSCWLDDLATVCAWSANAGNTVTGILAIRLGAALATAAVVAGKIPGIETTVFWQPVFDGNRHLSQFLRLRTAAAMMADNRAESVADLRGRLKNGEAIEVAGYRVGSALAADLDFVVSPSVLPDDLGSIHWIEVLRGVDSPMPAPSQKLIESMGGATRAVEVKKFTGESYWASTEILENMDVVDASVEAFAAARERES